MYKKNRKTLNTSASPILQLPDQSCESPSSELMDEKAERERQQAMEMVSAEKQKLNIFSLSQQVRDKNRSLVEKKLKVVDSLASFIVIAMICLALIQIERFTSATDSKPTNSSDSTNNILRLIIVVLAVALDVLIVLHYVFSLKKQNLYWVIIRTRHLCCLPTKSVLLILQLLICSAVMPPYWDATIQGTMLSGDFKYQADQIFFLLTLSKSYVLIRLAAHCSPWTSSVYKDLFRRSFQKPGYIFAIKAEFVKRPALLLLIGISATVLMGALFLRILERHFETAERDNGSEFNDFGSSMWMIIITMTTVGYGDLYPSTHFGRFCAVVGGFLGMVFVSVLVASLNHLIDFTPQEEKVHKILKKEAFEEETQKRAAQVIRSAFFLRRFSLNKQKKYDPMVKLAECRRWYVRLERQISLYKQAKRVSSSYASPIDFLLKGLNTKLEGDVEDIKQKMKCFPEITARVKRVMRDQKHFKEAIVKIQERQDQILRRIEALKE